MPDPLPPVERPNGKAYRPRKISAQLLWDADEWPVGAIVFGTHDAERALPLAKLAVQDYDRGYVPVDPVPVWWTDSYRDGRRWYETDEEHGRGGVWFRDLAEVTGG